MSMTAEEREIYDFLKEDSDFWLEYMAKIVAVCWLPKDEIPNKTIQFILSKLHEINSCYTEAMVERKRDMESCGGDLKVLYGSLI